jgi:hypothetical protein
MYVNEQSCPCFLTAAAMHNWLVAGAFRVGVPYYGHWPEGIQMASSVYEGSKALEFTGPKHKIFLLYHCNTM